MSDEIQYDDEGFAGHWTYSHKSNSRIFIREGEAPQQAFLRRQITQDERQKLYQIRKTAEDRAESAYRAQTLVGKVRNYRDWAKETYEGTCKELQKQGKLLNTVDVSNPESVLKASKELIHSYEGTEERDRNIDPSCYQTAGAVAAILDKKGFTSYRCYIGELRRPVEAQQRAGVSNHVWIDFNGQIYETFPGHDLQELTYRKANAEIFFYL